MKQRVAIVGAGLAGLTCAYKLQRRGIETVVFETSPKPGGRSTIEHVDGFTIDAGAQYLLGAELFRETFELIREIGLADDVIRIQPNAGQLYKGKVYRHRVASATDLLKFKGLNIADKLLLPRMAWMLRRFEFGPASDDETVAAFIKREFSQNILNYIAGPLISTLFFYSSEETSKLLYMRLAKHMHKMEMHTLRGGIGRIGERLAEIVQPRTSSKAGGIAGDGDAYIVNDERFTDIVIAVRGDDVLRIEGVSGLLSNEDQDFFRNCAYGRAVTLVVATNRPVDGACYGVSLPRVEGLSATAISFHEYLDSTRVPPGCGLLAITGGGDIVTEQSLVGDLKQIYRIEPRWTKAFEWTSAIPKFPPGRFRAIAAFMGRGRMHGLWFCGDYLMGPFVEGAISSGVRVAKAI